MAEQHDGELDDWDDGDEFASVLQEAADTSRLSVQDTAVASAADAAAGRLRPTDRRALASWPIALAAGLVAGAVLSPFSAPSGGPASPIPGAGLILPADATRSAGGGVEVAVAEADPAVWYRYIQELIYRGDFALAEEHLHAFNQLHPDYRSDR
ncbi:MAG: hypothetical protein AAGA68_07480 [Pseudomonadota bacterium]